MEIIKNVEVIDNTSEGYGVVKNENIIIFVKNSIIGDVVDVEIIDKKKNFWFGKNINFIKKSEFREDNYKDEFTDVFPFINMKYQKEVEIKKDIIKNNLKKNAKIIIDEIELIQNEKIYNYRNKIELKTDEDYNLCYYIDNGENKIQIESCPVTDSKINEFLSYLQEKLYLYKIKPYNLKNDSGILKNISIRANKNGEIIITLVIKKESDKVNKLISDLKEYKDLIKIFLSVNPKKNSQLIGNNIELKSSKKEFYDEIGKYKFKISPRSFFQVNKYQTEKLYEIAKEFLGENKNKTLLDLYSGIGTTTIYFSNNFKKVIGVEVVKDSISDAKENAVLNNIENVKFVYGKSEDKIQQILKENKIDIITVDPPRKGLDKKVVDTIIKTNVEKIVYISCNSSTLARDIKLFQDGGYKLEKLKAVDMFSRTSHVETVTLLSKLNS